jgi:cell division transport system permease protein
MKSSHRFITLGRIIHAGGLNFIRNAWLTTAATAIMTVTLTILLATIIFNKALGDTITEIAKDITISVYLRDTAPPEVTEQLRSQLLANQEVKNITYIDKAQAQSRYIDRFSGEETNLLDAINIVGNAFPASFEIELHNLSQNESVTEIVGRPEFTPAVDKFDENRLDTVDKIGDAQRFITRAGILAGSIFAVISILVIFNTIRMAIFTRSGEITIMRLIGATNSYIRGPFLFESMLYGIVAALVSTSLVYTTLTTLGPKADQHIYFDPTITLFSQYWYVVVGSTIAVGICIGVMSSSLAMARYMKR